MKTNPAAKASIEFAGRSMDDVYEEYMTFMSKDKGTITHRGPNSIQIIDRTDVSTIDICQIDSVQDDIDDAHERAKKAKRLVRKRLPDDY